jgi:hypothetical protein
MYWGEVHTGIGQARRWHRHEYAGRQFRILIEPRGRWDVTSFVVVKVDEVVSAEEVRMVRLPSELSGLDENKAVEAAHTAIARHARAS